MSRARRLGSVKRGFYLFSAAAVASVLHAVYNARRCIVIEYVDMASDVRQCQTI